MLQTKDLVGGTTTHYVRGANGETIAIYENGGWSYKQIAEAVQNGSKFKAVNKVNPGNTATRYVHPQTGQSVVVDDVTKEIIHVGGKGFKYD